MEVDNALSSAIDFLSSHARSCLPSRTRTNARRRRGRGGGGRHRRQGDGRQEPHQRVRGEALQHAGRDEYKDFIDEEAAVDYNFIKEFTKDNDADFNSSHYFSWDQKIDTRRH